MRTTLPLDPPSRFEARRPGPAAREYWAIASRSVEGDIEKIGSRFTVLKAIRYYTKGKCLHLGLRFSRRGTVGENTW
jgi:hypothetical protein